MPCPQELQCLRPLQRVHTRIEFKTDVGVADWLLDTDIDTADSVRHFDDAFELHQRGVLDVEPRGSLNGRNHTVDTALIEDRVHHDAVLLVLRFTVIIDALGRIDQRVARDGDHRSMRMIF